ncbi:DUF1501 domain-containing protein [Fretibacter rubidus]|uniref:DUF1501 domain-containing protein n=1 Tax=Fretibacter rubidus TaxID=570162 RepID=UPI00352B3D80
MLSRRHFAKLTAASLMGGAIASPVFASAPTEKRFILINLKGAMDGLHALAPYADPDYHRLRPTLGLGAAGTNREVLDLDGSFGLHPALKPLQALYRAKELTFIPAVSTQYRQRSHFEAQNMLEGGGASPYQQKTGWLNRAILEMGSTPHRIGLTLGPTIPLIMQGQADIRTWSDSRLPEADEGFLRRLESLYDNDPIFHKAFAQAQEDNSNSAMMENMRLGNGRLGFSTQAALSILKEKNGPRIAVIEAGGWDTHYAQERRLYKLFVELADSIALIKNDLGPMWKDTAVMVVSEFGRTAAENGSNGTDHGTGGLAIIAGGSINGGKIRGRWPGLSPSALLEERDLAPENHLESLFKSTLIQHLGLSETQVADTVFPGLQTIKMIENLYRP